MLTPAVRATPVWVTGRKPDSIAVILYSPTGAFGNVYRPSSLVTVLRSSPVPTLMSATSTPGNTPPVVSRTMPDSWAESNWARAGAAKNITPNSVSRAARWQYQDVDNGLRVIA